MQLGQLVRDRRENMGMSLSVLSREMGGSPGASFLSKVESATADVSASVAVRYADALKIPRTVMLNAAGYATTDQVDSALGQLTSLVGAPAPVMVPLRVVDETGVETNEVRSRLLRRKEDAFVIDLSGRDNEPYVGEALVSRERKPKEGTAVIAVVGGKATAWTWHTGRPTGDFLSRADGTKVSKNFRVLGVIVRVVSELDLDQDS